MRNAPNSGDLGGVFDAFESEKNRVNLWLNMGYLPLVFFRRRPKVYFELIWMTDFSWKHLLFLLCGGLLVGCTVATSGPVTITKVNPFHLNAQTSSASTVDPMLDFEPRRLLHGAVDIEDYEDRYGHYYTVFWKSENRSPATVMLEYRQGSSGSKVFAKEVEVASPKRKNTTNFQITGDEYSEGGKVTQWKVTILENGTKVAEYNSFLWKD